MKIFLLGVALLSFLAAQASARTIDNITIKTLGIDSGFPNKVFITINEPATITGRPACHKNASWSFVLDLNSADRDKMYAMLLAAKHSNSKVMIAGSGTCHSTEIEYVHVLYTK